MIKTPFSGSEACIDILLRIIIIGNGLQLFHIIIYNYGTFIYERHEMRDMKEHSKIREFLLHSM